MSNDNIEEQEDAKQRLVEHFAPPQSPKRMEDDELDNELEKINSKRAELLAERERRKASGEVFLVLSKSALLLHGPCSFEEAETYLKDQGQKKQAKGAQIYAAAPAAARAAGFAKEIADLRDALIGEQQRNIDLEATIAKEQEKLIHARANADARAEERDRVVNDLQELKRDFKEKLEKATEKERVTLTQARDATYLQNLRAELASLREHAKRLELEGDKTLNAKIALECRAIQQLETVVRVANGHPCPEKDAYAWSAAAAHVDLLWDKQRIAFERVTRAAAELQTAGPSTAMLHVHAARAILDEPLPHTPVIPVGQSTCTRCGRVSEDPSHVLVAL